ncbi:OmpA family protein [Flavobacteriales bacterium]|nr:OmpA family protein [Flavobacteriales bacterium]
MIKKRVISCLFFGCFFAQINAQENAIANAIHRDKSQIVAVKDSAITINNNNNLFWKGWMIGFNYGIVRFNGDLTQYDHYPAYQQSIDFHELRTGFVVSLFKNINSFYSLETSLMKGELAGLRRNYNTEDNLYFENLSDPYGLSQGQGEKFEADFYEIDLISKININTILSYVSNYKILNNLNFEGNIGLGYNVFNTVRTNLFSDEYIYSYGYEEYNGEVGGEIKKPITNQASETVFLYGFSVAYLINSDFDVDLTYNIRKGFNDKWDASLMQSEKNNDAFSFLSLGIRYNINKIEKNVEWISPLDRLKEDVSTVFVKIDGFTDDADSDGVSDAFDKSLNTPLGVAVDGSGRALDVDMDNISDYRDADPFSNRGAQVDVNGIELDDDKDGVPNSKDLESNTPVGVMVNQFGINISNTSYVNAGGMIYFPSIYFNSGSVMIVSSNENRIATIALILKKNPDVKLNVIGHTDNIGTLKFNKELGLKRANAVINYLVLNYDIGTDRLIATTKGEEEPLSAISQVYNRFESAVIESNNLARINRRVDFEIID